METPTESFEPPAAPGSQEHLALSPSANQIAQTLILAILFAVPALVCMFAKNVADPDIWWHLRTGEWILTHHAVPHTDHFTGFAAGQPWAAYSWLYELLVFKCFQWLGIAGILAYSTGMVLAITMAIYHLIRRLQPDFSLGVLLTLLTSLSLLRLFTPRSWLFTILFFTMQLDILLHARKIGKSRELLWLPLLYLLWANLHIQFFDGLVVLALAVAETIISRWWTSARTRVSPAWLCGVSIACVLATFINPFGLHIYQIGFRAASQKEILYLIQDFVALPFRTLPDFCMLFLGLAAAGALAWHRRLPLFETGLLAFAAIVSFRSQRDMWVMIIIAGAVLAQCLRTSREDRRPLPALAWPLIPVVTGLILFLGSRTMHIDNASLHAVVVNNLPVHAVEVVKKNHYAGPLYNTFDWGGYLIWDLRMPVSIDGRADLIGDKRLMRSAATWNGAPGWASDPDLQSAGLVIAPIALPLTQLLRTDSRFQLAYEDKLAAVFIARHLGETPAIPHPAH